MKGRSQRSIFKREAAWMIWLSVLPLSLGTLVALIVWLLR